MEAYGPDQLLYETGGPPSIEMLYRRDEIVGLLDGLEIVSATEVVRDIQEGPNHSGPSAVLQIVARKNVPGKIASADADGLH